MKQPARYNVTIGVLSRRLRGEYELKHARAIARSIERRHPGSCVGVSIVYSGFALYMDREQRARALIYHRLTSYPQWVHDRARGCA